MSDRTVVLTVVLDEPVRIEDDAQPLIQAISQLRGVVSVKANVADFGIYAAEERARYRLLGELRDVLFPKPGAGRK